MKVTAVGPQMRAFTVRVRQFSAQPQYTHPTVAQANAGDWPVEVTVQECPRLLKRDMKHLFPGMNFDNVNVSVMNITQKTENDMKAWSDEMDNERQMLTASFIASATAIATTLRRCGYWADFIDPSSGRPYLGKFTNHTLFETDDAYKDMGFQIEDLGCCKASYFSLSIFAEF
ncbi:hypothetical protein OESDEN_03357 [Oesophagostomum dentatum]|uniref:Uncharacterized protein n=1 Tax=Oesophagostomum dentatum TaxID=61180 RepID=A0A0B1TMT2_OESDE|nr:hypothetical protein OESDEN_03357 [Oesophagostomum dentatum]